MADNLDRLLTIEEELDESKIKTDKAKKVWEHYETAKSARSYKDIKYLEQYKLYRFQGQPPKYSWRSDIFIPRGHVNIVTKTARAHTAIMSSDPFFKAVAENAPFIQNEEAVESLMMQQHEDMDFVTMLYDWLLDKHIYGHGISKMYWKYEEAVEEVEETQMQPVWGDLGLGELVQIGEEPVKVKTQKTRVLFDGPMAEVCNIFDIFIDPKATSIKKARFVIHRREVTIDYLKKMVNYGYDEAAVNKILSDHAVGDTDSSEKREIDEMENEAHGKLDGKTITILEETTPYRIIVVGPNDTLLKDVQNPFKRINYFEFKNLRNAHKQGGVGVNEPVTKIQKAMNEVHRIRFDNWKIAVQRMFAVDMQAIYSPSDIVARPGGYIRVKGGYDTHKAIIQLDTPQIPVEAYTEQNYLERLDELGTGINDTMRGIDAGAGGTEETATRTRLTSAGASIRDGVELLLLEPTLKDFLQFQHEMNQMFLDMPRVVRKMGQEGVEYPLIGPDNIQGQYRFKFELSPVQGNHEAWLQRIMLVYQQFMQNPFLAPVVNWMQLGKRLLKASELRNPDTILSDQNMIMNAPFMPPEQLGIMDMLGGGTGQGAQPNMQQTGPATNPEVGRMNAKSRTPQPTAADIQRDTYGKVA